MGEHIVVVLNVLDLFGPGLHAAEVLKERHELFGSAKQVLPHGIEDFKKIRIPFDKFHIP
jgi:hypothetical protein